MLDELVRHKQLGCRYVTQERRLPHSIQNSIQWASAAILDEAWMAARGRDPQMADLMPCGTALLHDLRLLLRLALGRAGQPSAAIVDARILQSSPESGGRAGSDGHKRRTGSSCIRRGRRWAACWR